MKEIALFAGGLWILFGLISSIACCHNNSFWFHARVFVVGPLIFIPAVREWHLREREFD